jgi:glycosyltransferase involved in cell wall biosynthesis
MKIWAHTLVKNEENFIWFSVMSVIGYVDRILIHDTGSNDRTVEIIKEIKKLHPKKIIFREVGNIDINEFTSVRQRMLDEIKADWFLVVDGDEVWWDESIKKVVGFIKKFGKSFESVVVPTVNLVGDIYHYQEESAGKYRLAGRLGHLNLRGVNRNISGLKSDKPHGTWGWIDASGKMIQDRDEKKIKYLDTPYLHATFLKRSWSDGTHVPKRKRKLKHEIGVSFPPDYYYPEVFFRPRSTTIPNPWKHMQRSDYLLSLIQTPLRKIKRRFIRGGVGY